MSTALDTDRVTWLSRLYRQHGHSLVRFLHARTHNRDEAEDIAQEAWLRLHRVSAPESLDNPKGFLFQTAANLIIDRRRREKVEARHSRAEIEFRIAMEMSEPSAHVRLQQQLDLGRVQQMIAQLPLNCRQAFVMHRARGMSYPEIARTLGVSTSMVEKYVIQALRHCRSALARDPD